MSLIADIGKPNLKKNSHFGAVFIPNWRRKSLLWFTTDIVAASNKIFIISSEKSINSVHERSEQRQCNNISTWIHLLFIKKEKSFPTIFEKKVRRCQWVMQNEENEEKNPTVHLNKECFQIGQVSMQGYNSDRSRAKNCLCCGNWCLEKLWTNNRSSTGRFFTFSVRSLQIRQQPTPLMKEIVWLKDSLKQFQSLEFCLFRKKTVSKISRRMRYRRILYTIV